VFVCMLLLAPCSPFGPSVSTPATELYHTASYGKENYILTSKSYQSVSLKISMIKTVLYSIINDPISGQQYHAACIAIRLLIQVSVAHWIRFC